jgi:hypothetical protein
VGAELERCDGKRAAVYGDVVEGRGRSRVRTTGHEVSAECGYDDKAPDVLLEMWKGNGQDRALSTESLLEEMQYRAILRPEFDPEEEKKRIIDEMPSDPNEEEIAAAMVRGAGVQQNGQIGQ